MLQFSAVTLLHLQLVDCAPRISFQVLISSPFLSFLSVLSRLLHTDTYTGLLIRPPDDRPPRPHPQCSALATHSEYRCNSRTDRPSPTTVSAAREEPWKRRRKDALSLPLGSLSLSSRSPSLLPFFVISPSALFLAHGRFPPQHAVPSLMRRTGRPTGSMFYKLVGPLIFSENSLDFALFCFI